MNNGNSSCYCELFRIRSQPGQAEYLVEYINEPKLVFDDILPVFYIYKEAKTNPSNDYRQKISLKKCLDGFGFNYKYFLYTKTKNEDYIKQFNSVKNNKQKIRIKADKLANMLHKLDMDEKIILG